MTEQSPPDDELIERGLDLLPELGRAVLQALGRYHAAIHNGNGGHRRGGPYHGLRHGGGPRARKFKASMPGIKVGMYLYRNGPAKVGDIASWLGVSPPTVSEQVDHLVKEGWVERRVNPEDRREVLVELTPKAVELVSYIHELQRAQVRAMLEAFPPEERPTALRALEVFGQVMERDPREVLAEITSRETG